MVPRRFVEPILDAGDHPHISTADDAPEVFLDFLLSALIVGCASSGLFEGSREDFLFPGRKSLCEIFQIEVRPYEENLFAVAFSLIAAPRKMKVVEHGSADLKEYQQHVRNRSVEQLVVAGTNLNQVGPAWKSQIVPLTVVKFDLAVRSYLASVYS